MRVEAATFEQLPALIEAEVEKDPALTDWWFEPTKDGWAAYSYTARHKQPTRVTSPSPSPAEVTLRREKYNIHRAYLACMNLVEAREPYPPTRVRSVKGMEALLRSVLYHSRTSKAQVFRWSWPAEVVARAQYTRVWP